MKNAMTTSMVLAALTLGLGCEGPRGETGPEGPPGTPGLDPDADPLAKAAFAMGGEAALAALATVQIDATGERRMALQGYYPDDDAAPLSTFEVAIAQDVGGDRLRIDYQRDISLFGAGTSFSAIIAGELGFIDGTESVFGFPAGDMLSDRWAAIRKQQRLLNPQLIVKEVLADPRRASDGGVALLGGNLHHLLVVDDAVAPITLFVDARSGEVAKLETLENDYVTSDTRLEVFYLGWRAWPGDVRFPGVVVLALGGHIVHVERRSAVATNVELAPSLFEFPQGASPVHIAADAGRGERNHQFHEGFAALGLPFDGEQTFVAAEELAPGVFLVAGGTHHSLAIEQQGGVVLVEAPLNEARALAVLDWIEVTFPGKPVTHVISTHHHRDHAGALRTLAARGAVAVVGEEARAFFEESFRAARTIEPDELAKNPRATSVVGVPAGGALSLPDPSRPVAAHHLDTVHASDMLIIHLPEQGILFNSDLYSPGLPPVPFLAGELHAGITAKGLSVTTMAGGHGFGTATFAEFEAVLDPQ